MLQHVGGAHFMGNHHHDPAVGGQRASQPALDELFCTKSRNMFIKQH